MKLDRLAFAFAIFLVLAGSLGCGEASPDQSSISASDQGDAITQHSSALVEGCGIRSWADNGGYGWLQLIALNEGSSSSYYYAQNYSIDGNGNWNLQGSAEGPLEPNAGAGGYFWGGDHAVGVIYVY